MGGKELTPFQQELQEARELYAERERNQDEYAKAVREAFVDLRASTYLADHTGDVVSALGWDKLHALLGIDPESCAYCAGGGESLGGPCEHRSPEDCW